MDSIAKQISDQKLSTEETQNLAQRAAVRQYIDHPVRDQVLQVVYAFKDGSSLAVPYVSSY